MRHRPQVLVVDRDGAAIQAVVGFLKERDLEVVWVRDGESAFRALDRPRIDGLVTALRAPRIDGLAVLTRALERHPKVCAIALAAPDDGAAAIEAMRRGAADFQIHPVQLEKLAEVLRHGFDRQRLAAKVEALEEALDRRFGLEHLVGSSRAIGLVVDQIKHLGPSRATVLIEGESGTGKSLVARAIHRNSARRHEPFAWIDLEELPAVVVEAELFGEEAGGSSGTTIGRLELAGGGTLLLEEIAEASPGLQIQLLRVLQDQEFERVGGAETLRVDARILATTRRDLEAEVRAGRFREDLLQRLSVVRMALPPLRERIEDLPILAATFLKELNREHGRRAAGITRGALDRLEIHSWPGNLRELRNVLEAMVLPVEGRRFLDLTDLPAWLRAADRDAGKMSLEVGMTLDEVERRLIGETLRQTGFDKPRAAAMLGIGLRTLYRKIERYGLG